ncbi:hypothetical protein BXZ70DRAFT_958347 [Cristinia sonorae]|uniref:DUF6533 domain-containing protein n=1 Tax=Cristinia sonorae TaxID=1940300 RepID=A0A8K0UFN7_9AGAR|nr:hypothetical protein BXZ70DRAFT_958347 [Cristinia sonorae]
MSASSATELSENYRAYRENNNYIIAAKALFIWDYIITLDNEVRYVWGRKPTIATILFLLNRYVVLACMLFQLIVLGGTEVSCNSIVRIVQTLVVISLFVLAAFFSLRIYATWGRDWRPAVPILLLALVSPVANVWIYSQSTPVVAPFPAVGCAQYFIHDITVYSRLSIVIRTTTIASEFLVVLFTFVKAVGSRKSRHFNEQAPLFMCIIRDGTLHFLLMLTLNVIQLGIATVPGAPNILSYVITPLSSILISRFLLNLRQVNDVVQRDATTLFMNTTILSARQFHSEVIIGNLGESLYWGSGSEYSSSRGKVVNTTQDLSTDHDSLSASPCGDYEMNRLRNRDEGTETT